MPASFASASSGSRPELVTASYRRLRQLGFDEPAAANLAAFKRGFEVTSQPWTVRQLTHLLFLRELRRAGGNWAGTDDRADSAERTPDLPVAESTAAIEKAPSSPARQAHRGDADPSDGRVTLLTLFRSMAGPNASLDLPRLSNPPRPRLDPAGDADREGG
jgi:hypothetical protein